MRRALTRRINREGRVRHRRGESDVQGTCNPCWVYLPCGSDGVTDGVHGDRGFRFWRGTTSAHCQQINEI